MEFSWVEMQLADKSGVIRRTIHALESIGARYRLTGVLAAAAYGDARFGADVTADVHRQDFERLIEALPDF